MRFVWFNQPCFIWIKECKVSWRHCEYNAQLCRHFLICMFSLKNIVYKIHLTCWKKMLKAVQIIQNKLNPREQIALLWCVFLSFFFRSFPDYLAHYDFLFVCIGGIADTPAAARVRSALRDT